MRLRGLSGARDEFHLAAIVQNLAPNPWAPNPTARILCVKSLTIGSVQFASKSMHLGLLQQPPAQLSRKDRSANQKTTFLDSIRHKQKSRASESEETPSRLGDTFQG